MLGFLLALRLIWLTWDESGDPDWKSWLVVTVIALATTQAAGTESRRRGGDPVAVSRLALASHVSAAVAALLASIAIVDEVDDEGFLRALAAVVVGNVLLVALQPVVRRMGATVTQRVVCELEGGERVEREVAARDFAAAAERAIRELERSGRPVRGVERA
ncbi:MAG: hypothetical protein ICV64_06905 [Thermoleophilia bacterium]|nr:hypothetical protein [Thermoleophilia bacterium]